MTRGFSVLNGRRYLQKGEIILMLNKAPRQEDLWEVDV
jgi:hypothetical protein